MGQTIVEKICSNHCSRTVHAGDFVLARVDVTMGNDGSLPLVIEASRKIKSFSVKDPSNTILVLDHYCPSPSKEVSMLQQGIRDFAKLHGCTLYDWGAGVCHRLLPEQGHVLPGMLVAGADSHTVTYGALNAFSTGVGSTDLAIALNYGALWFRVPHTVRLEINGVLPRLVTAKDVALYVIKQFGASGANYQAVEVYGEAVEKMTMESRFTFCNMMVEMGAKATIMLVDEQTKSWLQKANKDVVLNPVAADSDAQYVKKMVLDISDLQPQVALPHQVDHVHDITEVIGTPVNMAVIGTCTNGNTQDLLAAANILKGKYVHPDVRLVVTPASKQVIQESIENGAYQTLVESGAVFNTPGCGSCVGAHGGIPSDDSNVFTTANRNFLGRMGNKKANMYLGSPVTVAAAAIAGKIVDPRTQA